MSEDVSKSSEPAPPRIELEGEAGRLGVGADGVWRLVVVVGFLVLVVLVSRRLKREKVVLVMRWTTRAVRTPMEIAVANCGISEWGVPFGMGCNGYEEDVRICIEAGKTCQSLCLVWGSGKTYR